MGGCRAKNRKINKLLYSGINLLKMLIYVARHTVGNNSSNIANCIFSLTKKK
jgi:hypothetical protein